jgi:ABC-2 type transport system permease protein
MSLYLSAAAGVVMRDIRIFKSYPTRFFTHILTIFFSVSLFYYVSRLVEVPQLGSSDGYFAFVVVGLATLEVLTATLSITPMTVRGELLAGTFERLATSAFGPTGGIAAMMVFPTILALVGSVVTVIVAKLVFGLELNGATTLLAIPTALLGALAFFPFALLLSAAVLVVKQAGTGAAFIVSGLSIVGGAMFPIALLPEAVQWISEVQPLTPALQLLRWELVDAPFEGSKLEAVAKMIGFAIVVLPIGLLALAGAVDYCRKRGTLTEY